MFALHLKYHASAQDIWFTTAEAAIAALEGLKPKLGDCYRNEELTHTIISPAATTVVVCSKVESASVVDVSKKEGLLESLARRRDDLELDYAERLEAAKARGLRSAQAGN